MLQLDPTSASYSTFLTFHVIIPKRLKSALIYAMAMPDVVSVWCMEQLRNVSLARVYVIFTV